MVSQGTYTYFSSTINYTKTTSKFCRFEIEAVTIRSFNALKEKFYLRKHKFESTRSHFIRLLKNQHAHLKGIINISHINQCWWTIRLLKLPFYKGWAFISKALVIRFNNEWQNYTQLSIVEEVYFTRCFCFLSYITVRSTLKWIILH